MATVNDRIDELLEQWETLRESGRAVSAAELCLDCPELVGDVQSAIDQLLAVDPFVKPDAETDSDACPLPEQIGSYHVLGEISRGGMGVVYRCRQANPPREVAVKVMALWRSAPTALARFFREVKILGMLHHAGIAQIYEAGTANLGVGTQPFFAMELVDGLPLDTYAQTHSLTPEGRLELLVKVCDAVAHAHDQGVIHRDLKPANILVDASGQPKVLDFGVARLTGADSEPLTSFHEGLVPIGSLPYMSPEQACDSTDLDARCDVYALGVIAYQLLAGRLPYPSLQGTLFQRIQVIREEPPLRLGTVNKAFRGDLERILAKALEKDRNLRYQSVSAFAADILRYLRGEPVLARPASGLYRFSRWCRRRPLVAGLSAALVLLLSVGPIAMYARERSLRESAEWAEREARRGFLKLHKHAAENYLYARANSEALQDELATKPIEFYERLVEERPQDPELRHEFSEVLHHTASICQQLSQPLPAVRYRRRGLALLDQLVSEFPDNNIYRYDQFYNQLQLFHDLGAAAEPGRFAALSKARDEIRTLLAHDPNNPIYLDASALVAQRWGDLLFSRGQNEEAVQTWRRAAETAQRLADAFPDRPLYIRNALTSLASLARYWANEGDGAEAVRIYNELVPRSERLWRQFSGQPFEADLAAEYCAFLQQHANILDSLGQTEQAIAQLTVAVEVLDELFERYPNLFRIQDALTGVLWELGCLSAEAQQQETAEGYFRRCFGILEQLVSDHPDVGWLRGRYAQFLRECPLPELRDPAKAKTLEPSDS
jgi:serine/threonine protein kinase